MTGWGINWFVAERDGSVIGQLDGVGGQVLWDGRARIQRVCRGTRFDRKQWEQVNPFADSFVPVFTAADGTATRLGLFTAASVPIVYREGPDAAVVEPYLVDSAFFLDQPSPYSFAGRIGETYGEVMRRLCDAAGVSRVVIDQTAQIFGSPVGTPAGTTFLQSLTTMAELAEFLPPHFDRDGVLRLRRPPALIDEPVASYDGASILSQSRLRNDNLLSAPNVIVVTSVDSNAVEVSGVAEVPPSAPHSVANRNGLRITKMVALQGLSSGQQAESIARQIATTQADEYEQTEFRTVPNPVHDTFDVVEVYGVSYRSLFWSIDLLPGGVMQHRLSRSGEVTL